MKLIIEIDDQKYTVEVPESLVTEADEFFAKMDADMDCGWQMSRWWVPDPDLTQRCQIVADKLLTALQKNNNDSVNLMCAYILKSKPDTRRVLINIEGEIQGNQFLPE
ncbi:MAG: hypothetical protein ACI9LO_000629 [Planctomycetota bacterium]|jgi:hypothetical protein